jgi:hypothetical protein
MTGQWLRFRHAPSGSPLRQRSVSCSCCFWFSIFVLRGRGHRRSATTAPTTMVTGSWTVMTLTAMATWPVSGARRGERRSDARRPSLSRDRRLFLLRRTRRGSRRRPWSRSTLRPASRATTPAGASVAPMTSACWRSTRSTVVAAIRTSAETTVKRRSVQPRSRVSGWRASPAWSLGTQGAEPRHPRAVTPTAAGCAARSAAYRRGLDVTVGAVWLSSMAAASPTRSVRMGSSASTLCATGGASVCAASTSATLTRSAGSGFPAVRAVTASLMARTSSGPVSVGIAAMGPARTMTTARRTTSVSSIDVSTSAPRLVTSAAKAVSARMTRPVCPSIHKTGAHAAVDVDRSMRAARHLERSLAQKQG